MVLACLKNASGVIYLSLSKNQNGQRIHSLVSSFVSWAGEKCHIPGGVPEEDGNMGANTI